jgi:hypothetical protein
MSYGTLLRVCLPLNKYRATVFFASLVIGILVFVPDYFVRVQTGEHQGEGVLLRFMWGGFAWSAPLVLLATLLVATGAYFLIAYFIEIRPKRIKEAHQ